jgi:hypothetical protein
LAEAEKNKIPTQFHHIDEQCMILVCRLDAKRSATPCVFLLFPEFFSTDFVDRLDHPRWQVQRQHVVD